LYHKYIKEGRNFMEWLKDIRRKKNLTPKKIAELVGCSKEHIYKIEAGERTPSVNTAKKIAEALGFDWTLFYEDTTQPKQ
jgi:putative transcriptional regulator